MAARVKIMNQIIKGKRYDTDTAKEVAWDSSAVGRNDFSFWQETLYQKRTGEFFLYGEGGAMSRYACSCGQNEWCGGEKIIPLTLSEAKKWAEEHIDGDEYEKIFGVVKEGKSNLVLSLDNSLIEKLKQAAVDHRMTVSEYITRALKEKL